jgi:hypothetical protein
MKRKSKDDYALLNELTALAISHHRGGKSLNEAQRRASFPFNSTLLAPLFFDSYFLSMLLHVNLLFPASCQQSIGQHKSELCSILVRHLQQRKTLGKQHVLVMRTSLLRYLMSTRKIAEASLVADDILRDGSAKDQPLFHSCLDALLRSSKWSAAMAALEHVATTKHTQKILCINATTLNLFVREFLRTRGESCMRVIDFGDERCRSSSFNSLFGLKSTAFPEPKRPLLREFVACMLLGNPHRWYSLFSVAPDQSSLFLLARLKSQRDVTSAAVAKDSTLLNYVSHHCDAPQIESLLLKSLLEHQHHEQARDVYGALRGRGARLDARFFESTISSLLYNPILSHHSNWPHRRTRLDYHFIYTLYSHMKTDSIPPSTPLLARLLHHYAKDPHHTTIKECRVLVSHMEEYFWDFVSSPTSPCSLDIDIVIRWALNLLRHQSSLSAIASKSLPLKNASNSPHIPRIIAQNQFYRMAAAIFIAFPSRINQHTFNYTVATILSLETDRDRALFLSSFFYSTVASSPLVSLMSPILKGILCIGKHKFGPDFVRVFYLKCRSSCLPTPTLSS